MLTPVDPPEKGYPHFRNIYLSHVKTTNVREFISASGENDSLRLENFYLHAIEAQAQKAGMIRFTRNFNATEIKLAVPEPHSMLLDPAFPTAGASQKPSAAEVGEPAVPLNLSSLR